MTHGAAAASTGLVVGVSTLSVAALCTYWFFHAREGGIELTGAAANPSTGLRVRLEPFGISGRF